MNIEENDTMNAGSPKYWLSLEQWRKDPEFEKMAQSEFLSSPLGEGATVTKEEGWARREFLKLMGASMALTSFGCVRRPAQKIVPYANRPEEVIPGEKSFYTSSFVDGNQGYGLVVTTREGRPIKVEGNPSHPVNGGGMSVRAHAHILDLYDPDRISGPKKGKDGAAQKWEDVDKAMVTALNQGGVAFLTSSMVSPSRKKIMKEFASAFKTKHFVWDGLSDSVRTGQEKSYGNSVAPRHRYDKVKYFVSIDSDFLGANSSATEATHQFSKNRKPGTEMSRLVSFESILSLTGMNADTRYRIRPSQQLDVVMGLLRYLILEKKASSYTNDSKVKGILEPFSGDLGLPAGTLKEVAEELWNNRGKSLVLAGGMAGQTENAVSLQVAVNFLNSVLDNEGQTVDASRSTYTGFNGNAGQLSDLVEAINKGEVKTLIIHGVNPGYSAPASIGFEAALKKVATKVYVGNRVDETGALCDHVLAESHSMEAWGDAEIQSGVYSIQQPTIRPLNDTRNLEENLMAWAKAAEKGSEALRGDSWYEYLRGVWKSDIQASNRSGMGLKSFDAFWLSVLEEGVFDTVGNKRDQKSSARRFKTSALSDIKKSGAKSGLELVLYSKVGLGDGSLANIAWLQELPDPVTKVVWDNYVMVSMKTATEKGLKTGSVVELTAGGQKMEVPVLIQAGLHDDVLGLAVGYGRTKAGQVADKIGVNAFKLAQVKDGQAVFAGMPVTMKKLSKSHDIANPQGHHTMLGRQIVVEATLEQYLKKPDANIHKHKIFNMWSGHKYDGHKWGMSIDLNQCTGCSSCVIACQSENNIYNVGKRYVMEGRIMHWIRVDRYYASEDPKGTTQKAFENPEALFMPVTCMHCDNAPCETVCPVAATVHSDEGLNEMVYNRCVGTRYCANNCPYKVRRFNWFNYEKENRSPLHLAMNPDVTVRARGVMEKCSFCNHRISGAQRKARIEKRELKTDEVQTACQQSCPANAITFGDVNDPESSVSKAMKDERTYSLLEEVHAAPALKYRTKIRNAKKIFSSNQSHGEGHH